MFILDEIHLQLSFGLGLNKNLAQSLFDFKILSCYSSTFYLNYISRHSQDHQLLTVMQLTDFTSAYEFPFLHSLWRMDMLLSTTIQKLHEWKLRVKELDLLQRPLEKRTSSPQCVHSIILVKINKK